jgi:hypothetical protein
MQQHEASRKSGQQQTIPSGTLPGTRVGQVAIAYANALLK